MAGTGLSERKRKRKKVENDSSESEEDEGASASENEWGDEDNNDYLDFLKEFLFPGQNSVNNSMEINDDDEADPEYNITDEEEEDDHDREELRRDPAVKISKKELNELLAEVFDEPKKKSKHKQKTNESNPQIQQQEGTDNQLQSQSQPPQNQPQHQDPNQNQPPDQSASSVVISPNDNILNNTTLPLPISDTNSGKPPEVLSMIEVENMEKPEPIINEISFLKIKYQLQRHIQLLSQTYVLTAACSDSEDALKLARDSKRMISELYGFSNSYGPMSVFRVKNIQFAFSLVNTWPASCTVSKSPIKKKILEERYMNEAIQISGGNGLIFTRNIVKIISENPVFMYSDLLPLYPSLQSEYKINFTKDEDALIAIGYREMQENSTYNILKTRQKAKLIGDMLLPGRPISQIFHRIKNARKMDKKQRRLHQGLQILRQYLSGEIIPESPLGSWTPELLQIEPIAPMYQTHLPPTWASLTKRLKLDILFKDDIEENVGKKPRKSTFNGKRKNSQNQNTQLENASSSTIQYKYECPKLDHSEDQNVKVVKKLSMNTTDLLKPVSASSDRRPFNICGQRDFLQHSGTTYISDSQHHSFESESMERIPVMNKDGTPAAYVNIPKRFYRPSVGAEALTPTPSTSSPACTTTTIEVAPPTLDVLNVTPVGAPFSLSVLQNQNISTVDSGCIIDIQSLESPLKREIFLKASQSPTEVTTTTISPAVVTTNAELNIKTPRKQILESSSSLPTKLLSATKSTEECNTEDRDCNAATGQSEASVTENYLEEYNSGNISQNCFEMPVSESSTSIVVSKTSEIRTNNKSEIVNQTQSIESSRDDHSARTWIYQRKSLEEIHAAIEKKLNEDKINEIFSSDCESTPDELVEISDSSSSSDNEDERSDNDSEVLPQNQVNTDSYPNNVRYLSVPELIPMELFTDSHSQSQNQNIISSDQNRNGELNTPFKSLETKPSQSQGINDVSPQPEPKDTGESKSDGSGNKSGSGSGTSSSRATRGAGASYKRDKQSAGRLGQTTSTGPGAGDGDGEDHDPPPPNRKVNPIDKQEDGEHKEEDTEDGDDDEKEISDHSPPRRSQSHPHRVKNETPGSKGQNSSQASAGGKKLKRSPGSQVKKRITKYKTAEIQKLLDEADSEVNVEEIETAFAEEFWTKCQHTVDPVLYNNLLQVFCDFEEKHTSEEEVFTKVEEMLKDYPDLLVDLATMIEPQLLQKNNLLKDNYVCQAYIRFMHLLEKLTLQCPPLKARVLQKLRAIRDLEKVTEKDVQELVDLYFQGNPIMTEALKAMFPAIFPPESIVRSEDFEEINFDDDSMMGNSEESMAVEFINLPEETNIPATSSCPCDCHTDSHNVSYHTKAKHCRKCCIKFQDGKVFMHSGRLMKQVNVAFTTKEKAEQVLAGKACGHCYAPLKTTSSGKSECKRKSVSKNSPKKKMTAVSRLRGVIGSDGDSEAEGIKGETELVARGRPVVNRREGSQSQEEDDLEEGEIVDDEDSDPEGDDYHSEKEIQSTKLKQLHAVPSTSKFSQDHLKSHQTEHHPHATTSKEREKQVHEKGKTEKEKSWSFDEDKIILFTCQQEPSATIAIEKILRSKALPIRTAEDIRDRLSHLLAMIRKSHIHTKGGTEKE